MAWIVKSSATLLNGKPHRAFSSLNIYVGDDWSLLFWLPHSYLIGQYLLFLENILLKDHLYFRWYLFAMDDEATGNRIQQETVAVISQDFVKRAIAYFASRPETIQTDKGFEFAYPKDYKRVDPFDLFW